MAYKGVVKGKMIALEEPLPYPDGQPLRVSVAPWAGPLYPGSPAAVRQGMHEPPHLRGEEVDEVERAMATGKLPVHHAGVFDERRQPRTFRLDTHVFSELMREHPKVDAHLASAAPAERVMICSVLFAILPCQPVPEAAGDHDATVKLTRERRGLALDENDLWIAATALA